MNIPDVQKYKWTFKNIVLYNTSSRLLFQNNLINNLICIFVNIIIKVNQLTIDKSINRDRIKIFLWYLIFDFDWKDLIIIALITVILP